MNVALFVLRMIVGALFFGHGAQKLFGWFGGHGPDATGSFFESAGMKPGRQMALLAGLAEATGGVLIAAGLLTPLAAALLTAVMVTAIWTIHRRHGLWITDNGYEYNLVLLAALFAITGVGAGGWSLDAAWNLDLDGVSWALIELGVGILAAWGTLALARLRERQSHRGDRTSAATA